MHWCPSLMLIKGRLWNHVFHVYSISLLISKKSNRPTQQKFTVVIASNKLLYQQHPAMHYLLMVAYHDNKNRLSKETGDATKTCCCNFASNNKIWHWAYSSYKSRSFLKYKKLCHGFPVMSWTIFCILSLLSDCANASRTKYAKN